MDPARKRRRGMRYGLPQCTRLHRPPRRRGTASGQTAGYRGIRLSPRRIQLRPRLSDPFPRPFLSHDLLPPAARRREGRNHRRLQLLGLGRLRKTGASALAAGRRLLRRPGTGGAGAQLGFRIRYDNVARDRAGKPHIAASRRFIGMRQRKPESCGSSSPNPAPGAPHPLRGASFSVSRTTPSTAYPGLTSRNAAT